MREARRRQGGCDLPVAKSSGVWCACFIQHGEKPPGGDGFVSAVGRQKREMERDARQEED